MAEADVVSVYAEAIRTLAREHHTDVVDLFAEWTGMKDWDRFFLLPEGDATQVYPNAAGQAAIAEALDKGLQQ